MQESGSKSRSLFWRLVIGVFVLGGISGVVLLGLFIWDGQRPYDLVILKADTRPIKQVPEDKGGLKYRKDSPSFDILDKTEDEDEEGVEILRPPISAPVPPPIDVADEGIDLSEAQSESEVAQDNGSDGIEIPTKGPETSKIVAPEAGAGVLRHVGQFGAFTSEGRAKNTAAVLSKQHQSRLDGMVLRYMYWDGFWLVISEPLPDAEAANDFCTKMNSVGQECFPKRVELPDG